MTAVATAVFLSATARAGDDVVFTADLPFDASQALPTWMHGPPVSAPGQGARVAFHLSPPAGKDLLVHFVFDETEGGGLRVEWLRDGSSMPELLAENLGESLGVPNQRPLLISASRMGGNGSLLLQGGSNLNVNRVKFEWMSERTMLSSTARYVPVVVTASRLTLAEADVDGVPRPVLRDEWRDRVVRAALTEGAELLTPSLELLAELDELSLALPPHSMYSTAVQCRNASLIRQNRDVLLTDLATFKLVTEERSRSAMAQPVACQR